MLYKDDAQRRAVMAAVRRAQMGVGSRGDIRTARWRTKNILKQRRTSGERLILSNPALGEDRKSRAKVWRKTRKREDKAYIKKSVADMRRRRKLLIAYRDYRAQKAAIIRKYPMTSIEEVLWRDQD